MEQFLAARSSADLLASLSAMQRAGRAPVSRAELAKAGQAKMREVGEHGWSKKVGKAYAKLVADTGKADAAGIPITSGSPGKAPPPQQMLQSTLAVRSGFAADVGAPPPAPLPAQQAKVVQPPLRPPPAASRASGGGEVVDNLPADIQRGFRFKVFALLALQLGGCFGVALVFGAVPAANRQLGAWLMGGADKLDSCADRPELRLCPERPVWVGHEQHAERCAQYEKATAGQDVPFECQQRTFWVYPLIACLATLALLFCCRVAYPFNYFTLAAFTLAEGLLVASCDYVFYSHVPYQLLGSACLTITLLAYFSTRAADERGWPTGMCGGATGARAPLHFSMQLGDVYGGGGGSGGGGGGGGALPHMSKAAGLSYGGMLFLAIVVQCIFAPGVWAHFIGAQFGAAMLFVWVLFDATKVSSKCTPDQYFAAVSMFYTDIIIMSFICLMVCFLGGSSEGDGGGGGDAGGGGGDMGGFGGDAGGAVAAGSADAV